MPSASVAPPSASATRPSRKLPVAHRALLGTVASRRPPRRRRRSRPRGAHASAEESGAVSEMTTVTPPPDDALASARAATVVVAPHAKTGVLPFMRSSRRGSGVVVSLDGAGGDLRVLTAAHVACLAGPNNRVDIRASDSGNARTRVGSVVAVHPRLDLALIKLDEEDAKDAMSETDQPFPSTFAPLASKPPPVAARVAALGYAMGWSSAFRTAMQAFRDDSAAGVWGELLATHEEAFRDEALDYFEEDERNHAQDSGATNEDDRRFTKKTVAFFLHAASVASGCSGGPLVSEAGEVLGVHSFGDAFYGGARDVAVATPRRVVESLGYYGSKTSSQKEKKSQPREKPLSPETYATRKVLAAIFASSDPALKAMCPELTPEQRKAWIL